MLCNNRNRIGNKCSACLSVRLRKAGMSAGKNCARCRVIPGQVRRHRVTAAGRDYRRPEVLVRRRTLRAPAANNTKFDQLFQNPRRMPLPPSVTITNFLWVGHTSAPKYLTDVKIIFLIFTSSHFNGASVRIISRNLPRKF